MSKLFEPLKIREVELKNRIVLSPMCQYSSEDGFANDWHLVHLGSRALGGTALVFTEATAVTPEGRISPWDLGIWKDEHIDFLQTITSFIEKHGAIPAMQLAHAGRKSSADTPWRGGKPIPPENGGWHTLAPSAVPFKEGDQVPRELGSGEIAKLVEAFGAAAVRAKKAGFRILEIHAAHGYLINEFLSPASNFRTDSYGGSFENRIRFLLEIVAAVRQNWPQDYPLFVRISASEWSEKGWTIEDSVQLASVLRNKDVDLIDCSSGGNVYKAPVAVGPLYQTPFAERVKKDAEILTGAVGLITTPQECEDIVSGGRADLVFLARQLLREPYFPLRAAKELNASVSWPVQYERAK